MKEQILDEILMGHELLVELPYSYKIELAEEIDKLTNEHYMRFIKWLVKDNKIWHDATGLRPRTTYEFNDKVYSLNGIYNYWKDNVLKK
jgi:hypothetical protein